jgi:hypothetical protein
MKPFVPNLGLRNPHLQSILASSPLRKALLKRVSAHWLASSQSRLLPGYQGSQLLAYHTPARHPKAPLAILIHGWEGTAESGYLLSAAHQLHSAGFQLVRLALRDHDQSHHLNRELFHSARLDEVVNAVRHLLLTTSANFATLIGFSLGGNFVLRVTRELSSESTPLATSIAVCPLMNAADTMRRLEQGPVIYHHYFTRKWKRSLRRKQQLFHRDFANTNLNQLRNLRQLTDYFVQHHTPFNDSTSYFESYSLDRDKLNGLTIPTHILMSKDDPIIYPAYLEPLRDHPFLHITACGSYIFY